MTAHDFEWSLRRVLSPETGAQYAYQLYCIEGARELHTGLDAVGQPVAPDSRAIWACALVDDAHPGDPADCGRRIGSST